jgi:hypothetical protein
MFRSKRASGKAVLVADIDDASVGISLVELSKSGPASVIVAERLMLPIEERTGAQSVSAILQLLEQCTDKVMKMHDATPTAIYVVLRAPWTRFRTAQAEEAFPEPRIITKDMIPTLAKKALTEPSELDRGNILEAGVMHVALNGYPTGNPVGKRATRIAVVAFEGDVNAEIKHGVVAVFEKLLPGRTPIFRTGMRALLTVLHEHIPDIHRYVILDVGGSATSCAIVRKEAVTQFAQIPEGATSIIRKISGASVPEETITHLRMLATDTCSTDACNAIKDSIAKLEPEFAKTYGEMFTSLAARRRLPNHAMLAAPAELTPWLQGFFSRIDFAQFTATTQPLEVEALTTDHLSESVVWKTGAAHDTGLTTAAGCVNILEQSS